MSRIYDALKKAEKEGSPYRVIGIEEVETPVVGRIPESSGADTASSSTSDPAALNTLLARCHQTTWEPDPKTMLFFGAEEHVGAEQFRTLRSQLYQLRDKQPLQRVLVSSSVPQEGRSFVAANLAQAMARQPGCRVLLIDADLRNPSLHLALGTKATPGLSEFLLGEAEEFGIIQRGQMENLFLIAAGRPIAGQTEIISNGRLQFLLDHLEPMFDWLIIDSPAAMPVTDSGLIANFCEGILLVVRSNSTPFDVVRKARKRLPEDRLMGVVLNGIPSNV